MTSGKTHSRLQTLILGLFGGWNDAQKVAFDDGLTPAASLSMPQVQAEREKLARQLAKIALTEANEPNVTERELRLATKAVNGALIEAFVGSSYSRIIGPGATPDKIRQLMYLI